MVLFAFCNDLFLLASGGDNNFEAEFQAVGKKIGTSNSRPLLLARKGEEPTWDQGGAASPDDEFWVFGGFDYEGKVKQETELSLLQQFCTELSLLWCCINV